MLLDAAARYDGVALEYRRAGRTVSSTYPQLGARVTEIAGGLIAIGVQPGDRVSIFATTSAEWTLADFGALCAGAVLAPVYHTSSAEECAYVLGHSGARVVFCGDGTQAAKVALVREQCPGVEHVILLEGPAEGDAVTLGQLCDRGHEAPADAVADRLAPGSQMPWPRWCTRRGRPARRRGACSPTPTCSRQRVCTSSSWTSTRPTRYTSSCPWPT